jgi:long-chain fatty acid transport protein
MLKNLGLWNVRNISKASALMLSLLCFFSNPVSAAAFALNDQGVTSLGNAYAGTSSIADDASTGYYNPAGLPELKYTQIVASGTYNYKHIKLYDAVARNSLGTIIIGTNPTKPQASLLVPAGHLAWKVNEKLSLAISVIEPFGLDIKYPPDSIARLMTTTGKITVVDISPTIGYKINKYLNVGAGLDIIHTSTAFGSDVAWGDNPPESLGFVTINGDDSWSIGYHVGILIKPWKCNRMGLVYFSRFDPKFSSNVQSDQTLDFGNPTRATYELKLPDRINYSLVQGVTKKFDVLGEVEWTHWSRLKYMQFSYNSIALPGIQSFYFKNAWRVSLGGDYRATSKIVLKAGLGWDQSPATNQNRSALIPDSDRYLLAVGAKFMLNQRVAVNFGYAHAFYRNTSIAESGLLNAFNLTPALVNGSTLNAKVKNSTDIIGLQLSCNFFKNKKSASPKTTSKTKAKSTAKAKAKR